MDGDGEKGAALVSFGPEPGPKPHRVRHDGFTPAKKRKFFKTLRESGCISDSARVAGVSRETVRRHRNKWPDFAARVEAELAFASGALEAIAWQRATVGAEEKIYRDGKLAFVRVKPSDAMLRLLLQGANPKKYGRTGTMPRGMALKALREEAEAKALEKLKPKFLASSEEVLDALVTRLKAFGQRVDAETEAAAREIRARRIAEGLPVSPEGMEEQERRAEE